ncbi:uncharacterized protein LOC141527441 [Cotesia typhae]|uniref:uncharacterized protein LOC141527441 n=1 Tax=Cotesia typhae TaxID=2053667 RepID=UPI003D684C3E
MDFMHEYGTLGHMVAVPKNAPEPKQVYYLPHHGVLREQSTTTKLRVVFNGSCKTTSQVSLNDIQHAGPKTQRDIFDNEVQEYQLKTVTYGTRSAPYLACRTLFQLVEDEKESYPLAVDSILKGSYVDDISGGADSIDHLNTIAQQLNSMCASACLPLDKWKSNTQEFIIPSTSQSKDKSSLHTFDESLSKVLGLSWSSTHDQFTFQSSISESAVITKRSILSEVAQLFDPLGLISPVVIKAKILLQQLWLEKLDWDDQLCPDTVNQWAKFREDISKLTELRIPRWINMQSNFYSVQLHGFSVASQLAMAAVVYLRITDCQGKSKVTLVCSKTRVAPIKRLTVPRLELSAAVLLAHLIKHTQSTLELQDVPVFLWTDSSITLAWVKNNPMKWKEYVGNRVSSIHQTLPNACWRYTSGKLNPADCASRGLNASQLISHHLWWTGPPWLAQSPEYWPMSGKPLAKSHALSRLTARLDHQGILRVGGRLQNSQLDHNSKHPPILPRQCKLSEFLIADAHARTFHGGTQLTLMYLRRQCWILGGRAPIKSFIQHCLVCARIRAVRTQLMAPLPSSRVTPSLVFETTGVDYAGPITLKTFQGRGADNELKRLFSKATSESKELQRLLTNDGTNWKFNPPGAPHMGGKWEAAVKSVKRHIQSSISETKFTFEDFSTLLAQVEAVLNSRPLSALSDDPEDLSALTPDCLKGGSEESYDTVHFKPSSEEEEEEEEEGNTPIVYSKRARLTSTVQITVEQCPAELVLRATKDKQKLQITQFNPEHDHDSSDKEPRLTKYKKLAASLVDNNIVDSFIGTDWSCDMCHKDLGISESIECDKCLYWSHWDCIDIKEEPSDWFCPKCITDVNKIERTEATDTTTINITIIFSNVINVLKLIIRLAKSIMKTVEDVVIAYLNFFVLHVL